MRALLTGAIAAIEGVAAALTTLLIVSGFAFLIWWLSFDLSAEPLVVLQTAGSVWLLAHFVPLQVDLSAETMQSLGFAAEALSFGLSLAPLGLTLVTVLFAVRSGWRFGNRGGSGAAGVLGGALGFGGSAAAVASFVEIVTLPVFLTALIPALVYGVGSAFAFLVRSAIERHEWWDRVWSKVEVWLAKARVPRPGIVRRRTSDAMRLTGLLVAGYVGLAALGFVCAAVLGFADVIGAAQSLQLDVWGVIMMFVLQLIMLPVFVVWSGAWLTGAGFAVGLGSSASPFGALLGPMPGVPIFAAIPDGWGQGAVLAPVLLALVGVLAGVLFGGTARRCSSGALALVVVAAACCTGLLVAALSWLASGSLGPGRLAATGPDLWLTAGLAAAELGFGCLLGAFAARADLAKRALSLASFERSSNTASVDASDPQVGVSPTPVSHIASENVGQGDSEFADDQLTEPLEFTLPDPPIEPEPEDESPASSAPPAREPELFDHHAAQEALLKAEAQIKPGGPVNAGDPDFDALVEAYSWDHVDEPPAQTKPGWRRPRRKR